MNRGDILIICSLYLVTTMLLCFLFLVSCGTPAQSAKMSILSNSDLMRGDIILHCYEVKDKKDAHISRDQMTTMYRSLEVMAGIMGLYKPAFNEMETWDGTDYPMGYKIMCSHIDYVYEPSGFIPNEVDTEGMVFIIMRLKNADIEPMLAEHAIPAPYRTPFKVGWCWWLRDAPDLGYEEYAREAYPDLQCEEELTPDGGRNCSSALGWALIAGGVIENFNWSLGKRNAIHALAPSGIAWWLEQTGKGKIIGEWRDE